MTKALAFMALVTLLLMGFDAQANRCPTDEELYCYSQCLRSGHPALGDCRTACDQAIREWKNFYYYSVRVDLSQSPDAVLIAQCRSHLASKKMGYYPQSVRFTFDWIINAYCPMFPPSYRRIGGCNR